MVQWCVLVYRVPTEPASGRVGVWRDLKQLGALYLQQCVCVFPNLPDLLTRIEKTLTKIDNLGGEQWLLPVASLPETDDSRLIQRFRELRNKEYAEIVEECETKFVKEIEFEHFRQNYTFEEAEEIGHDLEKIRIWFERISNRDWFDADGRPQVEDWIERCAVLLGAFEEEVYRRTTADLEEFPRNPATAPLVDAVEQADRANSGKWEEVSDD